MNSIERDTNNNNFHSHTQNNIFGQTMSVRTHTLVFLLSRSHMSERARFRERERKNERRREHKYENKRAIELPSLVVVSTLWVLREGRQEGRQEGRKEG